MRTYVCVCGSTLFFDNSLCLACRRELGFCPHCRALRALEPLGDSSGRYRCTDPACGAELFKCRNYAQHDACNWCVAPHAQVNAAQPALCRACRFTRTIPDLSFPENLTRWYRLEVAKRRLFFNLDLLGLPYGTAADGVTLPLCFDFKTDETAATDHWWTTTDAEPVFTGHLDGVVTINIREADDAERERLRVHLGEAHRTLIGHFRHEIGHYFWDLLIRNRREADFIAAFGDHQQPPYEQARQRYYEQGPPPDWAERFTSRYAAMHPWEDWAETFALLLDMASALDTAFNVGFTDRSYLGADLDTMVAVYQRLGIAMNEMNRAMGLIDLLPDVLHRPVTEKMRFIHSVVQEEAMSSTHDPLTRHRHAPTPAPTAPLDGGPGHGQTRIRV